jgi:hypothetical protein
MTEPIFYIAGREDMEKYNLWKVGWYFWDETESPHGPFDSQWEAQQQLDLYVKHL